MHTGVQTTLTRTHSQHPKQGLAFKCLDPTRSWSPCPSLCAASWGMRVTRVHARKYACIQPPQARGQRPPCEVTLNPLGSGNLLQTLASTLAPCNEPHAPAQPLRGGSEVRERQVCKSPGGRATHEAVHVRRAGILSVRLPDATAGRDGGMIPTAPSGPNFWLRGWLADMTLIQLRKFVGLLRRPIACRTRSNQNQSEHCSY